MIRTHVAIDVGVDHNESVEAAELIILAVWTKWQSLRFDEQ